MILYILSGRCEKWAGCGMLQITPIVESRLADARRKANVLAKLRTKENKTFRLRLHKVKVRIPIPKQAMIDTLRHEDPSYLLEEQTWIQSWKYDSVEEEDTHPEEKTTSD
jgi:predicted Zn-dependent protease